LGVGSICPWILLLLIHKRELSLTQKKKKKKKNPKKKKKKKIKKKKKKQSWKKRKQSWKPDLCSENPESWADLDFEAMMAAVVWVRRKGKRGAFAELKMADFWHCRKEEKEEIMFVECELKSLSWWVRESEEKMQREFTEQKPNYLRCFSLVQSVHTHTLSFLSLSLSFIHLLLTVFSSLISSSDVGCSSCYCNYYHYELSLSVTLSEVKAKKTPMLLTHFSLQF